MFDLFKGSKKKENLAPVTCAPNELVAPADSNLIPIENVKDEVFSEKIMGDGIAFELSGNEAVICAPASGTLSTLFKTGHAFGIVTDEGVELLIHIGIDTVALNGDGFKVHDVKSGDKVKAGDPIITADLKKIREKYDTTTMLIVTEDNGKKITFAEPGEVKRGQVVANMQ